MRGRRREGERREDEGKGRRESIENEGGYPAGKRVNK